MFPDWLLRAGAGIALAAVVVGGAFAFGLGPFEPAPTETPSIAVVTPAPPSEQPPSEPPPSEPPPSEPPLSEPPPSPTEEPPVALKEIALAVTGDQEGELGASLQLKCPKGQPCRREVKQRIKTMAGEFLNPYTGDGIQSTTSVSSDKSLPVLIVADRPIPWSTADQAQTGETSRVVVDLGPMLGGAQAGVVYAVVDTAEGTTRRFVVDPGAAEGLFNDVYQVVDIAPPVAVTPAPDIGLDQTIVGAWLWDQPYVLQLPDMNP
jgi:hypothetical protein